MNDDLYQKALVELARAAVPVATLPNATHRAVRDNPLCGDRVGVAARLDDGKAVAMAFDTRGCLICLAATTVAARKSPGWSAQDAENTLQAMRAWLKGGGMPYPELEAFKPVLPRKSRHDCVILPFEALRDLFQSSK